MKNAPHPFKKNSRQLLCFFFEKYLSLVLMAKKNALPENSENAFSIMNFAI